MGLLLKPIQVPLDGIPSFCHINHTTHLGVICKLAEGALNPTIYVVEENIKQYQSKDRPLRDTTCHRPPHGRRAIGHQFWTDCEELTYPLGTFNIHFLNID